VSLDSDDLLGKHVLVGVTCLDPEGQPLTQFQTHGVVGEIREDAIVMTRSDGSTFGLPPAPELLDEAEPGIYTLRETGESVEDPDFLASLTVTVHDLGNMPSSRRTGSSRLSRKRSGDVPRVLAPLERTRNLGDRERRHPSLSDHGVAELAHVRLYGGLPPVVRPRRWRWLIPGALFVAGVAAVVVTQALHSSPAATYISARPDHGAFAFDSHWLIWIGVAFIVGGSLGFAHVRGWWSTVAIDAVGLALLVALLAGAFSVSYTHIDAWFFWVFGVSAGAAVHRRIDRRRLRYG